MNKYISETWKKGGSGQYTNQDSMYLKYVKKLLPNFKGGKVLEIGPGSGGFALKLIKNFDIDEYHVLDLEKNINDSIKNIKKSNFENLYYTYSQNFEELFGIKFDLLVANVVIPETPIEYRTSLLNNVLPNCKSTMIIGQLKTKGLMLSHILNERNEYEKWIMKLYNDTYDIVNCELTTYKDCYALIGQNLK